MELPLSGVKVIDMTTVLMGPLASQMLGDMGADVIKIEPPTGDLVRDIPPMRNKGMGNIFLHTNRSKRSVVLDVKSTEGLEVIKGMLKDADVLLFNVRPNSMKRLGLSYEEVRKINPRIIYVGTFGFGQDGRYAAKPAFDDLIQGAIGIPNWVKQSGATVPRYVPSNIIDRTVGLYAASCIMSALYYREKSGKGQSIDVPMFETMISLQLPDHVSGYTYDPPIGEPGYGRLLSAERRPYETKDGYVCAVIYTDKQWRAFYKAIGREVDFDKDPRLANLSVRNLHIADIHQMTSKFFKEKTTQEWMDILEASDIPCMPLHDMHSLYQDPHLQDVGLFEHIDHPTEGRILKINVPTKWSESQPKETRPAPLFGEHSEEVLLEAGLSKEQIQNLIDKGVVKAHS